MRLLDVGGSGDWDWGAWTDGAPEITVINIDAGPQGESTHHLQGDARDLSRWSDGVFDIVFSNSVIEHVGDFSSQKRMADEIRRVAKAYWVQTPNRHFPIEPHMMFPFFQYLPVAWRRWLAPRWPFSFEKLRHGNPERDAVEVRLMTKRELQMCFPDGEIVAERFMGLVKSWIIFRKDPPAKNMT